MINLRYHIVSITAVFLALGIGITMGSTFLGKATLDRIDNNVKSARKENQKVTAENSELRKQVSLDTSRTEDLIAAATPRMFTDTLTGVPVVLVAADGVDQDSLDHLKVALTVSGAKFDGTLIATDKLALTGGDVSDLATALGSESTSPSLLRAELAKEVSDELLAAAVPPIGGLPTPDTTPGGETTTTTAPTTTTTTTAPTTVPPLTLPGAPTTTLPVETTTTTEPERRDPPTAIHALIDAGFLDFEPAIGAVVDNLLTSRGYRYVVVTGSTVTVTDADFVTPVLADMAADGPAPVVVASAAVGDDPESTRTTALAPLIKDNVIGDRVSTVDDLETLNGLVAVVWSVQDLGRDRHGHYGFGDGAKSQLPAARG